MHMGVAEIAWMSSTAFFYTLFMVFLFLWIKDKPSRVAAKRLLSGGRPAPRPSPDQLRHTAALGPMIPRPAASTIARRHNTPAAFPTPIPVDGPGNDSMAEKQLTLPPPRSMPMVPEVSPHPAPAVPDVAPAVPNQPDIRALSKMSARELSSMLADDPGLSYGSKPPMPMGGSLGAFPNTDMFSD
jgi:hypothetical protein